jgi:phosphate transport system protein
VTVHLEREIANLKKQLLVLGAMVEESLRSSVKAVEEGNSGIARRVIDGDAQIDAMEVQIEEECLKILALYQPVAGDLRFIVAILKINNDLERIGDQAVNIAERLIIMARRPAPEFVFDYSIMSTKTQDMLTMSLDALVNLDVDLAFKVLTLDDEVDAIKTDAYDKIKAAIQANPERVGYLVNMLLISRHMERLADHATNIAEEVIYLIEGEIVRHGKY